MKKSIWTILVLAMVCVFAFTACTSNAPAESSAATESSSEAPASETASAEESASEAPSTETASEEASETQYKIGFATISLEGDFLALLTEEIGKRVEERGHIFEVASAEGNATTQIEQIENFITLGMDAVLVAPVEPSGLTDVLQKAMDAGVGICCYSAEPEVYDLLFSVDDFDCGDQEAQMAATYIEEKYPDAEPGSIEVGIFEYRDTNLAALRSDGLQEITNYTDKVTVVDTVGVDQSSPEDAQTAAENLLLVYPDVKVILCYNGDMALGVNEYAMSMNSPIEDVSDFAIFSVDIQPQIVSLIQASASNESVYRGTIRMFASMDAMYSTFVEGLIAVCDGTNTEKVWDADLFQVTAANVDEYAD